jgi:hypothetical protein
LAGAIDVLGLLEYGDFWRPDFLLVRVRDTAPWKVVICQSRSSFSSSVLPWEERLFFLLGDCSTVVDLVRRPDPPSTVMEDALVVVVELVHDIMLALCADAASCGATGGPA